MTDATGSPLVDSGALFFDIFETYGSNGPQTLYTVAGGTAAVIESVYVQGSQPGNNTECNGTFVVRLVNQSGLIQYQATSPYFDFPVEDFDNDAIYELTWARGASACSTVADATQFPADGHPNRAWATMPLPEFALGNNGFVELEVFNGWNVDETSPATTFSIASVTYTEVGSSTSTTVSVIPFLVPQG